MSPQKTRYTIELEQTDDGGWTADVLELGIRAYRKTLTSAIIAVVQMMTPSVKQVFQKVIFDEDIVKATAEGRKEVERGDIVPLDVLLSGAMTDDLKERRNQDDSINKLNEAFEATKQLESFQAFAQWANEHMNEPVERLGYTVNSLVGSITGSIIGNWFDAGATPEVLKEYFNRFIDITWSQYQTAIRLAAAGQPDSADK